jgi:cysteinyl-tRNA synthetase
LLRGVHYDTKLQREPPAAIVAALLDDLNTPEAITKLRSAFRHQDADALGAGMSFLGLLAPVLVEQDDILLFDPTVSLPNDQKAKVEDLVAARLAARKAKDFKEGDRIRDELAAMGIALKDAKDPNTGEITTSWEVAR